MVAKALGREPSAALEAKRKADKEPGQKRGTDTAANSLRARMAELGKQVRPAANDKLSDARCRLPNR